MSTVKINLFQCGYCFHPERMTIQGGSFRPCQFPATSILIEHPQHGFILIDTGYADHIIQATRHFPNKLYRLITPIHFDEKDSLKMQLQAMNIGADKIRYIIISHFHGDHIAGLKDFPNAQFIASKKAYEALQKKSHFKALMNAYLPSLLPDNFSERLLPIEKITKIFLKKEYSPFEEAHDLFMDGKILIVELPGHALGHYGVIIEGAKPIFYIADACWFANTYKQLRLPSKIANLLMSDKNDYHATIHKIHQLWKSNPNLFILPAHCHETIKAFKEYNQ